jgi:hypothetical protein
MTLWSTLFPDLALNKGTEVIRVPGAYNRAVPAGANFVRVSARGCGGQGDSWGGGGALARSIVAVTPGDNLVVQVGNTSTAGTPGDSFVKRNDGSVIVYADRGRGNGNGGKAAFSTGQIVRDGQASVPGSGIGGDAADDLGDVWPILGVGTHSAFTADVGAKPGGGGKRDPYFHNGEFFTYVAPYPSGAGSVALEFFDKNPGL